MYSGTIIIHNIPKCGNNTSIAAINLTDSSIENFKNKVAEIFKSNEWNITTTRFQKNGFSKLYKFDQMTSGDFIFTTVNAYLIVNI